MASLLAILIPLMRAVPALESLFRLAITERDKDREREAAARHAAKDAAVDQWIDQGRITEHTEANPEATEKKA